MVKGWLIGLMVGAVGLLSASDRWERSDFIWVFDLVTACKKGVPKSPTQYFAKDPSFDKRAYRKIQAGDLVWVHPRFLGRFCREVLPSVKHPFALLISDGDESFPSECGDHFDLNPLLESDKVVHIFAQNCDYSGKSPKISPIPLGLDFHTIAYKKSTLGWGAKGSPAEQEAILRGVIAGLLPTSERKVRAFVDFQHSDSMRTGGQKRYLQCGEDRTAIFQRLLKTGVIDYDNFMSRQDLWRRKGEYAFSISPHGNGLDCHRTWEDLALGCIVIVKTSPLDPLYEGLPVVIVQDWSEVTEENLERWLAQYGDASTNPSYRERLTNRYWLSKMGGVDAKKAAGSTG